MYPTERGSCVISPPLAGSRRFSAASRDQRDVYFFPPQWRQALYVHLGVILVSSAAVLALFTDVLGCKDMLCVLSHMKGVRKVSGFAVILGLI